MFARTRLRICPWHSLKRKALTQTKYESVLVTSKLQIAKNMAHVINDPLLHVI